MTDVIEVNRQAWDGVASTHKSINLQTIIENLSSKPGFYIDDVLRCELEKALHGNSVDPVVAQFNCNNGRELISAVQLGFSRGYGFDFSGEFIKQAQNYTTFTNADCRFVQTDIYEIEEEYSDITDVLFLTAGAMCWMPDLQKYFEKAYDVLKPGGRLVLWETHPYLEMFKPDRDRIRDGDLDLIMHYPYFLDQPVQLDSGLDYYSNEIDEDLDAPLWFHHTLASIIQSVIDNHFTIETFNEHDFDNSIGYRNVESFKVRPPMSFILSAVKRS